MASKSSKRKSSNDEVEENGGQKKRKTVLKLDLKSVLLLSPKSNSCLVFLKEGQEVGLLGKVELTVVHGTVSVLGHLLKPSSAKQRIYSPSYSSLITVTERNCQSAPESSDVFVKDRIKEVLNSKDKGLIKKAISRTKKSSAVLLMSKLENLETEFVTSFAEYKHIFAIASSQKEDSQEGSECSTSRKTISLGFELIEPSEKTHKILSVPDEWSPVIKDVISSVNNSQTNGTSYPIILTCGGKDVGKSSFGRYLLNFLLNSSDSVFFLECDLGQSEFTPPSFISLTEINQPIFGPPFTHLLQPLRSCFYGDVTPRDNPDFYIRCIHDVFQHYNLHLRQKGPLVVNTQGWVKGLGVPLLVDVIRIVKPTHIIQLNSSSQKSKNMSTLTPEKIGSMQGWVYPFVDMKQLSEVERSDDKDRQCIDKIPAIYQLESVHSTENIDSSLMLKPQDMRVMSLLSYFSQLQKSQYQNSINEDEKWKPQTLDVFQPYKVSWKKVAINVLHTEVDWSQILYSFNATIVGLAVADSNQVIYENDDEGRPGKLKESSTLQCLGLGIVRNIDVKKKRFYILTPIEKSELKKVNVLLKGNLEIPTILWPEGRSKRQPYITSEFSYQIRGSGARKVRFNLLRRKFGTSDGETPEKKTLQAS